MNAAASEPLLARIVRLRRERGALDPQCAAERRERIENELRLAECSQLDLDIQAYLAGETPRPPAQPESASGGALTSAGAIAALAGFLLREPASDVAPISQNQKNL